VEERKKPGQVAAKFREPAGLNPPSLQLPETTEEKLWRVFFVLQPSQSRRG